MNQDLEIARTVQPEAIDAVARSIGILDEEVTAYGKDKAKIKGTWKRLHDQPDGNLILVTAMTPTPAGEGKSTTTIGLADGLHKLGKKTIACLREPSMGPVFGLKGGAAGGGHAQVIPMESINLHFTGDMHAITAVNNLIAAMLDNSIYQDNPLQIDVNRVVWTRCVDMNDRPLRTITIAQGARINGVERQDHFVITVATEVMAVLCLSKNLRDFQDRIGRCIVAYTFDGRPVTVRDLHADGAAAVLMQEAIHPNLVQTLEHTPVFIHGGPFANIAHGCNSLIATGTALKLADYVVTEAGFGADLGAEKFFDIKCRIGGLKPSAVVLVATIRALKSHGGISREKLREENVAALLAGTVNLERHIASIKAFNLPFIVAINRFVDDTEAEIQALRDWCRKHDYPVAESQGWAKGGEGCLELAEKVTDLCRQPNNFHPLYEENLSLTDKVRVIAETVYGAADVEWNPQAAEKLAAWQAGGYGNLPVCMAKTPLSLSDDPKQLGRPENFTLHVRDVSLSAGAGFVVVYTGNVLTMPGLPKDPAGAHMGLDAAGNAYGIF